MPNVRPMAVAGQFYPAEPPELIRLIDSQLAAADAPSTACEPPKAMIVPHAGYVYSGAIAARAYARLHGSARQITRVVLLGPAHRVALRGLAGCHADLYRTPLGLLAQDWSAIEQALELPQVRMLDPAHRHEHSIEVQLPFLQCVLDDFKIAPLLVGDADTESVAEVLERLWGGPETLIVISSDLSHFLDYEAACERDRLTSQAILGLAAERIADDDACGYRAVRGLLRVAQRRGLTAHEVERCNSGDTAGRRDRVVGYGAYVFQ